MSNGQELECRKENNMSDNEEGFNYGFVQYSRSWYADACRLPGDAMEEIMIGLYALEGGCKWEFAIRWIRLPNPTPRVEIFSDGWQAFAEVPELFTELAKRDSLTPIECCELLKNLGFTDMTKSESPYQQTAEQPDDMIEGVAIAISAWRWDRKTDEPWERINEPVKEAYRDQARAAIAAMQAQATATK